MAGVPETAPPGRAARATDIEREYWSMKHERFEIAWDNHSEEDYYTENGIQHLNTYLGDELSKAFAEYQKKYPGIWNTYRRYLRSHDTHNWKESEYEEALLTFRLKRYVTDDHQDVWEDEL